MRERIGKYLEVEKQVRPAHRKTDRWTVYGTTAELGEISWYGPWRQYTFDPAEGTTFNGACLRDLTRFLDRINQEHRTAWSTSPRKSWT